MAGLPVRIADVAVDPPYTNSAGRVRYRVTLACGCFWWEDHPSEAPPPVAGKMLSCWHRHSRSYEQRPAVAAAASTPNIRLVSPNEAMPAQSIGPNR
jgi:hypothetical protein